MPQPESNRRDFLRSCGCAMAGVAVGAMGSALTGCELSEVIAGGKSSATTVEIDVSRLTTDNTGLKTGRGPGHGPIMVIRKAEGEFRAMSAVCPHTDTFTVTLPDDKMMICPGHQSRFDIDGNVLDGLALPFVRLKQYASTYERARKVLIVTVVS